MANRNNVHPSETAVRISIPYLTNCIVTLPFVGMVASFLTSVLFTKEQIFESECGVRILIRKREKQTNNKAFLIEFILVTEFYSIVFICHWCVSR